MAKRRLFSILICIGVALSLLLVTLNRYLSQQSSVEIPTLSPYVATQRAFLPTAQASLKLAYLASIPAFDRWKAANINNYTVVIKDTVAMRTMTNIVVVRNGKVIRGENSYTIENLFNRLKYDENSGNIYGCLQNASFNQTYGFPTAISINCRFAADMFGTLNVIYFQIDNDDEEF